jgi:hypothetical protein
MMKAGEKENAPENYDGEIPSRTVGYQNSEEDMIIIAQKISGLLGFRYAEIFIGK